MPYDAPEAEVAPLPEVLLEPPPDDEPPDDEPPDEAPVVDEDAADVPDDSLPAADALLVDEDDAFDERLSVR